MYFMDGNLIADIIFCGLFYQTDLLLELVVFFTF